MHVPHVAAAQVPLHLVAYPLRHQRLHHGPALYMSPEQAKGMNDTLDERSDLYSLTAVFHEFLHLDHYLEGRTEVHDVLEGVKTFTPVLGRMTTGKNQVPAELDWFLEKGFAKDPAGRYASVEEMTEELQRIIPASAGCGASAPS